MKYKINEDISMYRLASMEPIKHRIDSILYYFLYNYPTFSIHHILDERQINIIAANWPNVIEYLELYGYVVKSPEFKKGDIVKMTDYWFSIWILDGNFVKSTDVNNTIGINDTFLVLEMLSDSSFFGTTKEHNVMLRRQKDNVACFTNVKFLSY